jgi:hypothetical protein
MTAVATSDTSGGRSGPQPGVAARFGRYADAVRVLAGLEFAVVPSRD